MVDGSQSNSEPIEPTQVWTQEEWRREQPWGAMPPGDLRRFFKEEGFVHIYGGGPSKMRDLFDNMRPLEVEDRVTIRVRREQ